MKKKATKFTSARQLLDYLNDTHVRLHKKFEDLFWLTRMGQAEKGPAMATAEQARDAFRADAALKLEVESQIKKAKGKIKARLLIWKHFFDLYQTPDHALVIKKRVADLEVALLEKRGKRKEGYVDPVTNSFIEASENQMRMLMRTHKDEAVRKACFDAMEKLPLDLLDEYIEIIKGRNEFARALGFENFYAYKARIDEDMDMDELFSVFEKIYDKTKYAFENIRKMEKQRPGLRKPWNFAYMLTGNFVAEEDPYFQFDDVLSYWGRSFAALGIGFRGGKVTLDLLDREGKWNNGFCHYPDLVHYKKGKFIPGSSGFTSNAVYGQVGSGVLGIDTVFHEAGHAADRLNSLQEDTCINTEYPPSSVSWAETHSMFMDSISSSIEWKTRYAKNEKGESYPFELFERKLRAVYPLRPLEMMHIHFVMAFEREVYEHKNLTRDAVLEIARTINKKFFDRSEESISILNVPHIYSWESSAYYHGYGLAELGVCQWREYFFKKYGYIVDNPKVGKEITKVWSYASLYPAKKLIRIATGKSLSPDAFIRIVTKPFDAFIAETKKRVADMKKVPLYTKPVDLNGTITLVHGKQKIADNKKSFEDMDKKWRAWLRKLPRN
ncbi:MAG: hypothetical protein KBC33_01275 [Candidatus Pacebacteria bacterium]|nr:hypothetical protein [Candidatus Paceibacterota bacterium]